MNENFSSMAKYGTQHPNRELKHIIIARGFISNVALSQNTESNITYVFSHGHYYKKGNIARTYLTLYDKTQGEIEKLFF